ncbi:MAG: nucleotidyltransferase family protein [Candidatus Melainabacteria bacterium]|nr:nucleotidyltransferase family protein [Candidatus Melainabacteria bacterium]
MAVAVKVVDSIGYGLALVVDDNNRLLGSVTDASIRQCILARIGFDQPVKMIMETSMTDSRLVRIEGSAFAVSTDERNVVTGLLRAEHSEPAVAEHRVVLMVGGKGERLRPLTDNCPKPLLEVKGKPLLERTIERLSKQGFKNIYLTVHHYAAMIESFFETGSRWGVSIEYLYEKERLGTAGALGMLPDEEFERPILVMNGDLVTTIKFPDLLAFHRLCGSVATICVAPYDVAIPYGVVSHEGFAMRGILEKPVERHFINAGIYILNPSALHLVPKGKPFDMPMLFDRLMEAGEKVGVCPLREQWIDIGSIDTFEQAQRECIDDEDNEEVRARMASELPVVQSTGRLGTVGPFVI